jgi:hypothetical protein
VTWLRLVVMLVGVLALFALCDAIFSRGRRSWELGARVIEQAPWRFRHRPPKNGERR